MVYLNSRESCIHKDYIFRNLSNMLALHAYTLHKFLHITSNLFLILEYCFLKNDLQIILHLKIVTFFNFLAMIVHKCSLIVKKNNLILKIRILQILLSRLSDITINTHTYACTHKQAIITIQNSFISIDQYQMKLGSLIMYVKKFSS